METHNDQLAHIDPDLNIYFSNIEKQCQNYDTSEEFKSKYGIQNNISLLHSNIWSTSQLLRPSGQQCSHSGGVCPQIQGRQCGAYVGAQSTELVWILDFKQILLLLLLLLL